MTNNEKKIKSVKFSAILLMAIMLLSMVACGNKTTSEEYGEFQWPDSEIAKLLPVPESKTGNILWESSDGFAIDVAETSEEQYNDYVSKCKENGFTVDYTKGDNYYYADNEDGYSLSLNYEENNVMYISISEPYEEEETTVAEETTEEVTKAEETTKEQEPKKSESSSKTSSGVTPEFKETMDSYEKFMNEYVDFMKKYSESDDTIGMLSEYSDMMEEYTTYVEKIDEIDEDELSEADLAYYLEVTTRVYEKLLTVE